MKYTHGHRDRERYLWKKGRKLESKKNIDIHDEVENEKYWQKCTNPIEIYWEKSVITIETKKRQGSTLDNLQAYRHSVYRHIFEKNV